MTTVLRSLEWTHNTGFGADDIREWPEDALETLLASGILRQSGLSHSVTCRECDEQCSVAVDYDEHEDGPAKAFFDCPVRDDIGRVRVPIEQLQSWSVSGQGLAATLATAMRLPTAPEETIPGRLWWLGPHYESQHRADLFFVLGSSWADSSSLFSGVRKIEECGRAVLLVAGDVPPLLPFGSVAATLSLVRLLSLGKDGLKIDSGEIAAVLRKTRAKRIQDVARFPTPAGTEWQQVSIRFIDDDSAVVSAGSASEPLDFRKMGFHDRRTEGSPDKLWGLLQFMALRDGRLGWDDRLSRGDILKRKRQISDLRRRLQAYFGIAGDPFEPYKKANAYQARFVITRAQMRRR